MLKNIIRHVSLVALALSLFAVPARAQQYALSNTTLNGSINSSQTTLVLTSASKSTGSSFGDPAAGQCLFIDAELMRIVSMSSTTATVTRATGSGGGADAGGGTNTAAAPHPSGAVIFTGACNAFKQGDPPIPTNSATIASNSNNACSTQPAPWINVQSGNIWWCNTSNNKWSGTNYRPITYNSVPTAQ